MNTSKISRRDFLKLGSISLLSSTFRSLTDWLPPGEGSEFSIIGIGRVGVKEISLFKEPSLESEVIRKLKRDELIPLIEEIISPFGPQSNPRWYRTIRGFTHSAYLQRVENRHVNSPLPWVQEEGLLGEITVPYTRAYRQTKMYGWVPVYRLYYQSVHWITGVEEGPNKYPWYKLTDELLPVDYYVPARNVRPITPEEISPISPDVPWEDKRIEVSLKHQTLIAFEGTKLVMNTQISSGIPNLYSSNGIPTHTPSGRFNIDIKMPSKHMGDGRLSDNIDAYELPGVPWVCFFHETGVAFHGTYWHNNFGNRMSHGCVNMRPEEAKWLYRWAFPVAEAHVWEQKGYGTRVLVT